MTIDIEPGTNTIDVFPGSQEIPFKQYDNYLYSICLCSVSTQRAPVCYRAGSVIVPINKFVPGEGVYYIEALSAFQIEYN